MSNSENGSGARPSGGSRTVYRIQHLSGRIEETTDRRVAACASRDGCRVAAVTRSGP